MYSHVQGVCLFFPLCICSRSSCISICYLFVGLHVAKTKVTNLSFRCSCLCYVFCYVLYRRLRDEVDHLRRNVEQAQSKRGDDPLVVFRQQAALIAKKREQAELKLSSAEKAKESLNNKLSAMQNQVQALAGGQRMSNTDFKKYAVNIREKATKYKKYKAKLAIIHSESVVLNRTEAVLKSRCDNLEDVMANIEKSKGVEGYTSTQNTLEQISNATAALNSTKGKTLEEISKIVTDINHAVTDRKKKLQPLINKLKGLRPTYKGTTYLFLGLYFLGGGGGRER